jgi:hypothetical protein
MKGVGCLPGGGNRHVDGPGGTIAEILLAVAGRKA